MMTAEEFVERLSKQFQRRRFLRVAGTAATGFGAALLGSRRSASADVGIASPKCCNLCDPLTPIGQGCSGAYCTWQWTCCDDGTSYRCIEGYQQGGCPGIGNCEPSTWRCSAIFANGSC
jgi:hypothetical protein